MILDLQEHWEQFELCSQLPRQAGKTFQTNLGREKHYFYFYVRQREEKEFPY